MRVHRKAKSESFDSLLDTLTNVVGILIIVLAVLRITVDDTGERIRRQEETSGQVTTTMIQAIQGELYRLQTVHESLASHRESLEEWGKKLAGIIAGLESRVAQLERDRGEGTPEQSRQDLQDPLAHAENMVGRLQTRRLRTSMELAELKKKKDGSRQRARADSIRLRLPVPETPPNQSDPVYFFCRYGRVVKVGRDVLFDELDTATRTVVGLALQPFSKRRNSAAARKLAEYLEEVPAGNENFRWRITEVDRSFLKRLDWRQRSVGETATEIALERSRFRTDLDTLRSQDHFLQFYVWSDSFPAYLEARGIAQNRGLRVGWKAFDKNEDFESHLFGSVPQEPQIDG